MADKQSEFGEPLAILDEPLSVPYWPDDKEYLVYTTSDPDQEHCAKVSDMEFAVRIVACVNALAGIRRPERLAALLSECEKITRTTVYDIPKLQAAYAALYAD